MPITLLAQDLNDIWNISSHVAIDTAAAGMGEAYYGLRHTFFAGQWQEFRSSDFWLAIHNVCFNEDIVIKSPAASWGPVSSFFITGTVKSQHQGLTGENIERSGGHYLEYIQDGCEVEQFFVDNPVIRVRFGLSPSFLQRLAAACTLPAELKPLIETEASSSFYRQGKTTSEMQEILRQILSCPYQGFLRQLYLEGKVLELSALQFSQFIDQSDSRFFNSTLKPDEIERIYQARDILIGQYHHPPSLLELARRVGLNDFKLKQGFRQVFGMTVFGFLREFRLEQALTLLSDRHLTVQQVAHAVGYSHTGYFAKAFKHKYGISPKAYQLGKGRIRP